MSRDALIAAARDAMAKAYAPYSHFQVGAAVLGEDGAIYAGCNVENAAYPQGACAEANALAAMVLGGARRAIAIAVIAKGAELVTPCGGCRQRMREFAGADLEIHLCTADGRVETTTLGALLPRSFGPDHLS